MIRTVLLALVLIALVGCTSGAGALPTTPTIVAELASPDAAAEATIAAIPLEETGLITVPFAAGAREYLFRLPLPSHWAGRYAVTNEGPGDLTFSYTPNDQERIRLFTISGRTEEEWDPAATPGAIPLTTVEGIVFTYVPGDADALAATGPDATAMLAELPAILSQIEIRRNDEPSG